MVSLRTGTNQRNASIWKNSALVAEYLRQVRRGIPLAEAQLDVMMRVIEGRGTPVQNFVDLGCGAGILAATILAEYPTARGVLVDFSEPMIQAAINNLGRYSRNLQIANLDYSNPDWLKVIHRRGPFDVIVSGFSIHHQPDPVKKQVYRDIYDLLEPEGVFVNIEHVASASEHLGKLHDEFFIDSMWANQEGERVTRSRASVAKRYHERPDREANQLSPVEDQCSWLRQIGFEDVDCYFKAFEFAVFGGTKPKEIE